MHLTASESRCLSRLFGLLAEDMAEREVRERLGLGLLDLLKADYFASYVWDEAAHRFDGRVTLNMNDDTLGSYEAYYQFHDPITYALQARRVPTLVTQVMPQRELMRTEFFNDFLARDGLRWGVNVYSYVDGRNIGDLRIWRGKQRDNFDGHTLDLLNLIEPAFTGALHRASLRARLAGTEEAAAAELSPRELAVARMVGEGLTDKQIAQQLGVELSTVRTYLKRTFAKLGVQRRGGLAAAIGRPRNA
ncbi:MAG: LuxR family transcriptional regulator [Rhodocyclaceae bacterium]|nr:LuxR family transcriptional regulator [Rhodocyclaceae bacterium]